MPSTFTYLSPLTCRSLRSATTGRNKPTSGNDQTISSSKRRRRKRGRRAAIKHGVAKGASSRRTRCGKEKGATRWNAMYEGGRTTGFGTSIMSLSGASRINFLSCTGTRDSSGYLSLSLSLCANWITQVASFCVQRVKESRKGRARVIEKRKRVIVWGKHVVREAIVYVEQFLSVDKVDRTPVVRRRRFISSWKSFRQREKFFCGMSFIYLFIYSFTGTEKCPLVQKVTQL